MALTPQNNDAFFREVDEELRRDQVGTLWRRYGRLMLLGLALALAALAAFLWWQHDRTEKAGADGETLTHVLADLSEGKTEGAQAKLDTLAGSPRDGYRAAARLTSAAIALDRKDTKAAAASYAAVAGDATLPQAFRDLALVRRTAVEFDTLPPSTVIDRLKPLAGGGQAWSASAGEMVAIAHLKMNQPQLAGPVFAAIAKDESAPESLRSRATRMAGALGLDVVAQPTGAGKE